MSRRMLVSGGALLGLCLVAALVLADGIVQRSTVITDFVNGLRLNGGTTITGTSGSQDSAVVLPPNSVGGGEVSGAHFDLIYCGQADENGTIYLSPAAGINGATIGARPELASATCDGLDGATEATQDIVIFPNNAFKVMGMYCMQSGAEVLGASETVALTFRAAAADVTPSITCTISAGETGCASLTGTTTNVAANTPTAVKAAMVSNNSDQDLWCSVSIMLQ